MRADDDDLPDHDYESIYGHEALEARQAARMKQLMERQEQQLRRLEALTTRLHASQRPCEAR